VAPRVVGYHRVAVVVSCLARQGFLCSGLGLTLTLAE